MVTLAIWGEVTPGAILTECGLWGDMVDVITCAIFRDCRLRGVGVVRGASLPSPIDLTRRPYNTGHTTVWPCDEVELPPKNNFGIFASLTSSVCGDTEIVDKHFELDRTTMTCGPQTDRSTEPQSDRSASLAPKNMWKLLPATCCNREQVTVIMTGATKTAETAESTATENFGQMRRTVSDFVSKF